MEPQKPQLVALRQDNLEVCSEFAMSWSDVSVAAALECSHSVQFHFHRCQLLLDIKRRPVNFLDANLYLRVLFTETLTQDSGCQKRSKEEL